MIQVTLSAKWKQTHRFWKLWLPKRKSLGRNSLGVDGHAHQFQFSSVAQSCPTLCDPINRSTPGLPVHHTTIHKVDNQQEATRQQRELCSIFYSNLYGKRIEEWIYVYMCVYIYNTYIHIYNCMCVCIYIHIYTT